MDVYIVFLKPKATNRTLVKDLCHECTSAGLWLQCAPSNCFLMMLLFESVCQLLVSRSLVPSLGLSQVIKTAGLKGYCCFAIVVLAVFSVTCDSYGPGMRALVQMCAVGSGNVK